MSYVPAVAIDPPWVAGSVTFAASAAPALLAWLQPGAVQHMGVVAVLFGPVGMRASGTQIWSFVRKPAEKMFWWYGHLEGFIGSYVAAWSAFSVVTLPRLFGYHLWLWIWPTAVGMPAIALTTGYYRRKFASRVHPVPAGVTA